jgi:uncharacterized protein (TIGR00725 family)
MGSGTSAEEMRCRELGGWLANEGVHLLTGGGGGAMAAVSRGFFESTNRAGLVLGVLPARAQGASEPPAGYPNRWVEVPIRTHLHLSGPAGTDPASRNHINVLSSDVIIALPGSWGTRSEVELAVQYERPLVAYLRARDEIPQLPETVMVVSTLQDLGAFVRKALGGAP